MTIYSVNIIYSRWVSHMYEPIAFFSTKERAERYKAVCDAEKGESQHRDPEMFGYGYEVDEWIVDDPRQLAAMGDAA
jgi:hypothetical protein